MRTLLTMAMWSASVFTVAILLFPLCVLSAPTKSTLYCKTDTDCLDGGDPSMALKCVSGKCASPSTGKVCMSGFDCGNMSTCRNGVCALGVEGDMCVASAECYMGHSCHNRWCTKGLKGVPCELDMKGVQCARGYTCVGQPPRCEMGAMGAPCAMDRNCAKGLVCIEEQCAKKGMKDAMTDGENTEPGKGGDVETRELPEQNTMEPSFGPGEEMTPAPSTEAFVEELEEVPTPAADAVADPSPFVFAPVPGFDGEPIKKLPHITEPILLADGVTVPASRRQSR